MIVIDYKDSRPIYEQINDRFRLLILKGILEKDEKIPSVRQLAMELSTNPNTVQKAYAELERAGYIYTVQGKGNFVSDISDLTDNERIRLRDNIADILREARDIGLSCEEIANEAVEIVKKEKKGGQRSDRG